LTYYISFESLQSLVSKFGDKIASIHKSTLCQVTSAYSPTCSVKISWRLPVWKLRSVWSELFCKTLLKYDVGECTVLDWVL